MQPRWNTIAGARSETDQERGAAVLTVYLWDVGAWSGVSGTLEAAQRHVADRMGKDGHGRIEAAWLVIGLVSLTRCYERTGQAWTAYRRPDGAVFWAPVGRERLREVS